MQRDGRHNSYENFEDFHNKDNSLLAEFLTDLARITTEKNKGHREDHNTYTLTVLIWKELTCCKKQYNLLKIVVVEGD